MGKRYYCDYCERSFADGAENRKKHLASVSHQKVRKAHYDTFKDASTILQEDKVKKPCRKFQSTGFCEFSFGCKYSHLTPLDIQKLEEQARMEQLNRIEGKSRVEPDIDAWLQSRISKMKELNSSISNTEHSVVPSAIANISNLPPSLMPPSVSDFYNSQKRNTPEWG